MRILKFKKLKLSMLAHLKLIYLPQLVFADATIQLYGINYCEYNLSNVEVTHRSGTASDSMAFKGRVDSALFNQLIYPSPHLILDMGKYNGQTINIYTGSQRNRHLYDGWLHSSDKYYFSVKDLDLNDWVTLNWGKSTNPYPHSSERGGSIQIISWSSNSWVDFWGNPRVYFTFCGAGYANYTSTDYSLLFKASAWLWGNNDNNKFNQLVEIGGGEVYDWVRINLPVAVASIAVNTGNPAILEDHAGRLGTQYSGWPGFTAIALKMATFNTTDDYLWPYYVQIQQHMVDNLYEKLPGGGIAPQISFTMSAKSEYDKYKLPLALGKPIVWNKDAIRDPNKNQLLYASSISNSLALYIFAFNAITGWSYDQNDSLRIAEDVWNWFEYSGVKTSTSFYDGVRYAANDPKYSSIDFGNFPYYKGIYALGSYLLYKKTHQFKYLSAAEQVVDQIINQDPQKFFIPGADPGDTRIYYGLEAYHLAQYLRFNPYSSHREQIITYLNQRAEAIKADMDEEGLYTGKGCPSIGCQARAVFILSAAMYANIVKNNFSQ